MQHHHLTMLQKHSYSEIKSLAAIILNLSTYWMGISFSFYMIKKSVACKLDTPVNSTKTVGAAPPEPSAS